MKYEVNFVVKDFEDWVFDDLMAWSKATILLSLGTGDLEQAILEVIRKSEDWRRDALIHRDPAFLRRQNAQLRAGRAHSKAIMKAANKKTAEKDKKAKKARKSGR